MALSERRINITTITKINAANAPANGAGNTSGVESSPFADALSAIDMDITGKRGVDAVIELDLTTNAKLIPSVLRPKGTVVVYGTGPEAVLPAAFCLVNSIRLQFFLVYELDAKKRERAVSDINDALKSRMLINRLAHPTFSLAQTAAAHEAVERGSIGNVILVF